MSSSGDSRSNERKTFKSVSSEFADKTSMIGVNFIHLSKKMWLKLIWLVIVLAACGAMIFHLYYLCSIYAGFPKQTKITLGFDGLRFPAVTLCNINAIKLSKLKESGWRMEQLINEANTTNQIRIINETETERDAVTTTTAAPSVSRRKKRSIYNWNVTVSNSYEQYTDNSSFFQDGWTREANRSTEAKLGQEFVDLFSKLPRWKRVYLGHQLDDFVVRSTFAGRVITVQPDNQTFFTRQSMQYGNCFTMQYGDFISRKSGPGDGLEVVLFLETDEYLPGWTNGNGAHLVIHEVDTVPLIEQDGVAISGGSETFIGIKRVNIQRLGRPYGSCNDGKEYRKKYNVTYTRQICQDLCLAKLTLEKCKCYDRRLEETNFVFQMRDDYDACNATHDIRCVLEVERDFTYGKYKNGCVCDNPCNETKFERSISTRHWPSSSYTQVLLEAMCKADPWRCATLRQYDKTDLSHNFIKLNIYYEDLNYENITEEPDYEDAQFLSDIGGSLGLWIGLSIVSIFEIGQFVIELTAVCCRCGESKRNKTSHDDLSGSQKHPNHIPPAATQFHDYPDYKASYRH